MGNIAAAAVIMGSLGLFFGTVLAVANRFLAVEEDPRILAVEAALPGSNCGACGEPGCRAFAESVVGRTSSPGKCTVSSPAAIESIADLLGVEAGTELRKVARLHCAGGHNRAKRVASYEGMQTCRTAAMTAAGGKSCSWGCLGLADCERSCTFRAIAMNSDGLPQVDAALCTACGDCVGACPKDLFDIQPVAQTLLVQCVIPLHGEQAREHCDVACDACGRCAQDAAPGMINMVNNLPVIDSTAGVTEAATPLSDAVLRCPTGAITWLATAQQFGGTEPSPPYAP